MVFIGTSGWSYPHWDKVFYKSGIRSWERLPYYVQRFDTSELNSSFYRWPTNDHFKKWNQVLPQGFLLSVKAPKALTHIKRLYQPERWIAKISYGWHELRDRRAVLLVQLSPNFPLDYPRLAYFLAQLPVWMRIAVEFRHPSWHCQEIFDLLKHHGAAYCVMSGAGLPCHLIATASFVYVRMHGPDDRHLYSGSYTNDHLYWWRDRIREWEQQGKDVYVYFNNDGHGYAVQNAQTLRDLSR